MSSNQLEKKGIKYTGNDAKITLSAGKMSSLFYTCVYCSNVCKKRYNFPRESRAVMHILSQGHHKALKQLNDADITERLQRSIKRSCVATVEHDEVIRRSQHYVAQNVAARSLPFSAGEMVLDCISASLCSIGGAEPISDKAVRMLTKNGFMDDAAALQRLKYASSTRNRAGPLPAKSDSPRSETTI